MSAKGLSAEAVKVRTVARSGHPLLSLKDSSAGGDNDHGSMRKFLLHNASIQLTFCCDTGHKLCHIRFRVKKSLIYRAAPL